MFPRERQTRGRAGHRRGLPWAFTDLRDAAAAIEQILLSYGEQCVAARALAEERFDACRVAGSVLELAL